MSDPKRVYADCRDYPDEHCTLYMAGTEEEVLPVVVRHAVIEHKHPDTPELREALRESLKVEA